MEVSDKAMATQVAPNGSQQQNVAALAIQQDAGQSRDIDTANACPTCSGKRYIKGVRSLSYCSVKTCECRDTEQDCKHRGVQVSTCWQPCPQCGDQQADVLPALREYSSDRRVREMHPLEVLARRHKKLLA